MKNNQVVKFWKDIFRKRRIIFDLIKNDFKMKFAGAQLGILWAFIQPIVTICVFWFVFQSGFKSPPVENFPFILWLCAGIIPWYFISDCINNCTNSLIEYSYLVKKIVFRTSVLPVIKVFSALIIHLFFILFVIVMFWVYGFKVDWYYLQILYYLCASIILMIGIAWINSAIVVFFKDLQQFISVLLQILFWLSPIFWNVNIMPEKFLKILRINPIFYIIQGYRDSFIDKIWFWERPVQTGVFWAIAVVVLIVGIRVYKRLKPHFADVL